MNDEETSSGSGDEEHETGATNVARSSRQAVGPGLNALGGASIRESVRSGIREARARGEGAADLSRHYAQQAGAAARGAAAGARHYAREAVNASGRPIRRARSRFEGGRHRWQGEDYVSDQPVRAALLAAAGGALLTALFIALLRGNSRR